MASKQEKEPSPEPDEMKTQSSPSTKKKGLKTKAVGALKTVKRKLSPKKPKDEPLIDEPPPPGPPPPLPPRPRETESDYLRWKSTPSIEMPTESSFVMEHSDSLSGVSEIGGVERQDSSKSCPETSEGKPKCRRTSSSKSEPLPSVDE